LLMDNLSAPEQLTQWGQWLPIMAPFSYSSDLNSIEEALSDVKTPHGNATPKAPFGTMAEALEAVSFGYTCRYFELPRCTKPQLTHYDNCPKPRCAIRLMVTA
jgi:hypothetical protein